jgi:hypothetical protein
VEERWGGLSHHEREQSESYLSRIEALNDEIVGCDAEKGGDY